MFSFHKPHKRRKVKLDIINAIELKPEANYILVCDTKTFKREQVESMLKDLKRHGVRNVVSFMLSGSPDEAIQLITKEKSSAKRV
jgi:hypothetical protein